MLDGYVPSLLMLVVPGAGIPVRRSITKWIETLRSINIHRGGWEVVAGPRGRNIGIRTAIRSSRTTGNVWIVERIVYETKIQRRSIAG